MNAILPHLEKYASRKIILALFVVTNAIYATMLVFSIPRVMQYANGMKPFDMLPGGYNMDYAQKLLDTLGEAGRHAYLFQQIPFDMVYPGLFVITYALLMTLILQQILKAGSKLRYLSLLPFFSGAFDYLENIGIITMLNSYPRITPELVAFSSTFSVLKSVCTTLVFTALLIGIIALLWKRWSKGGV